MKKQILTILIILSLAHTHIVTANEVINYKNGKYPDYGTMFVGFDKHEKFNRKMFNFTLKTNKYVFRPIHTIWTSILPKQVIDHIQMAYTNIEYPKRLVSTLIQKDYKHSKSESKRFLINTTLGIVGIFDVADSKFHIKAVNEDMEQALAVRKVKMGSYILLPFVTPTTTRNIGGLILDTALNPTTYLFFSGFIISGIKTGLLINRTSKYQSLAKMIESGYADPYDMAKKLYGIEKNILIENYDRQEMIDEYNEKFIKNEIQISNNKISYKPDITLENYFPQDSVTDALRTAFFTKPEVYKSAWYETSIWNKSFNNKIKTRKLQISKDRKPYQYRYILQKDKKSPLVILYPSTGESIYSSHSVFFGKMFFDKGYSVLILGSPFQWEFAQSMPEDYRPGNPKTDIEYLKTVTKSAILDLEKKYNHSFSTKVVLGTSLGGLMALALANEENIENTLNIKKFIAICPPIDLIYSLKQFDKNSEEWKKLSDIKEEIIVTGAKVSNVFSTQSLNEDNLKNLKFSQEEAKLITGFIMHQKMSDVVFAIENKKDTNKDELYEKINNMNFEDYANEYLTKNKTMKNIQQDASLFTMEDYLKNNNNYKIYQSIDDFINSEEDILKLKSISQDKMIILSNGSHLGFLYRKEFQDDLEKEIINNLEKEDYIILKSPAKKELN